MKGKKTTKRANGRKGNAKKDIREEEYTSKENGEMTDRKFRNHPSDFIPDEAIRKQVGSFSFNNTIGIPLRLDSSVSGSGHRVNLDIPSVMSIKLFSSIGAIDGTSSIDGINVSGQKYYNILSSINAKTTQYQPEDISLVEVLITSLLEQVANAMRIYGVVFNWNPRNRDIPRNLVKAMGVDPDSLESNGDIAAFRMRLNRLLTMANGIKFLKDLRIFKRSYELFSRIFIDENSSMGQYYVFRPAGYWILTETSSEDRASWVQRENLIAAYELLDDIENIIRTLLGSSLFNYIYTDILNYVNKKGGELLTFSYVPELVQVFGVYDPAILNQIHNMTWGGADLSSYKIKDEVLNNRIVTTNPIKSASTSFVLYSCNGDQILDQSYTDQPTYDDNVDAVAFKSAYDNVYEAEGLLVAQGTYLPDHPVLNVDILFGNQVMSIPTCSIADSNTQAGNLFLLLQKLSTFRVAPLVWFMDTATGTKTSFIGSLNFYTEIAPKQLANMFDYYYLGLYNIEVSDVKSFQ